MHIFKYFLLFVTLLRMFGIAWFLHLTTQMSWSRMEIQDMVKYLCILHWLCYEHLWAEICWRQWHASLKPSSAIRLNLFIYFVHSSLSLKLAEWIIEGLFIKKRRRRKIICVLSTAWHVAEHKFLDLCSKHFLKLEKVGMRERESYDCFIPWRFSHWIVTNIR